MLNVLALFMHKGRDQMVKVLTNKPNETKKVQDNIMINKAHTIEGH